MVMERKPKKGRNNVQDNEMLMCHLINQKYGNKIVQKYIEMPYLIEPAGKIMKKIKHKVVKRRPIVKQKQ